MSITFPRLLQKLGLVLVLGTLTACAPDPFLMAAQQEEKDNQHLLELLQRTTLAEVKFDNLSPREAFLSLFSQVNDKLGHDPIQYVLKTREEKSTQKISLSLKNIPMMEALRYTSAITAYSFVLRRGRLLIFLGHLTPEEKLTHRVYPVPPSYFKRATPRAAKEDVKKALSDLGVEFGPETQAYYFPSKNLLVVHNEPEQLDLIDQLLKLFVDKAP